MQLNAYIGEALVEIQAQLDKGLIVRDIGTVYKKGGYKLG